MRGRMRLAWRWWQLSVASLGCALALASFAPPAKAIDANGSFIQVTGHAAIYRVVGGAAIHVDSCAPLGGCPNLRHISSLAGYAAVPANGSFLRMANGPVAGWIGRAIGGSFVHVDSCAPLGGCPGWVNLDVGGAEDYLAAHPLPANGSFLRMANGPVAGWIGEAIGGSFVHVDSCAPLGGCPGWVNLDVGGAEDYLAAHPLPPDGSFMRIANGPSAGWIGEVIGQALIHVDTCAPLGGCPGTVNFDAGGIDDYRNSHPLPLNGTYVRVADGPQAGLISRAAGGALLTISDCAPLGGCGPARALDSAGFSDWVRAHPVPADGTLLLALPSNSTWEVLAGQRQATGASPAAVAVDDSSLGPIPVAPPAESGHRIVALPVPAPILRYVHVSLRLAWRWDWRVTELVSARARGLRRTMTITITCHGPGCPYQRVAGARAARMLRRLSGRLFRAGDNVVITIDAPGLQPERIGLRIRDGRIPRARLLAP